MLTVFILPIICLAICLAIVLYLRTCVDTTLWLWLLVYIVLCLFSCAFALAFLLLTRAILYPFALIGRVAFCDSLHNFISLYRSFVPWYVGIRATRSIDDFLVVFFGGLLAIADIICMRQWGQ